MPRGFQEIDQAHQHGSALRRHARCRSMQIGDRIDDDSLRLESPSRSDACAASASRGRTGVGRRARETAAVSCRPRAPGRCRSSACCGRSVAAIPRRRNRGSARRAGRRRRRNARPRWSCRLPAVPRHQDAGAAEVAFAAQHRVQLGDAGRRRARWRPRGPARSDVIGSTEMPCSSIRNGYSLVPCARAAILDDAQAPRRHLLVDAVVEQDHAVGDVLLQAVAGQRAFAPLAGDDGGDALVLEPAEQPAQSRRAGWPRSSSPAKSASMVSSTTRLAPTVSTACRSRTNRPSRSYSPVSSISLRSMCT